MKKTDSTVAVIEAPDQIIAQVDVADLMPSPETRPAKLTKEEKAAALQKRVPWKIEEYQYNHDRNIEAWMEDNGHYPTIYRAYTREEWQKLITTVAGAVTSLPETAPEYQRLTGLYIEDQSDSYLLARGKRWQIAIEIPGKRVNASTKRIRVETPEGRYDNYMSNSLVPSFVEFILEHVPEDDRDFVLDICTQYVKEIRTHMNRRAWAEANPDLAHVVVNKS